MQAGVKAAQKRTGAGFTVETVNPARMGGEEGAGGPPAFGGAAQRDEAEGAEAAKPSKKVPARSTAVKQHRFPCSENDGAGILLPCRSNMLSACFTSPSGDA